jgi:hypothetical protein
VDVYFISGDPGGNWIQTLSAIAAPLAASVAAAVACWQFHLQKQTLKLGLFDRRYAVYEAVRTFLAGFARNARTEESETTTMLRETRGGVWLFGSEVTDFIKELTTKSNKLRTLESVPRDPVRQPEIEELISWMATSAPVIAHHTFAPYLNLYVPKHGWFYKRKPKLPK